jgi:hypothetical protein
MVVGRDLEDHPLAREELHQFDVLPVSVRGATPDFENQ